MLQRVLGGVLIVMGLVAAGVGMVLARHGFRAARRTYHRTASLSAATLEGWDAWFLGGFSGMTMGIRWLSTIAAWLAWTLAGIGLVGLGFRLMHGS